MKARAAVVRESREPDHRLQDRWGRNKEYRDKFQVFVHGFNEREHGRNRVNVSCRYLLLVCKLIIDGKLEGSIAQHGNTVQDYMRGRRLQQQASKNAGGPVQEAHQLMTELTVGGRILCTHSGLTLEGKRALIGLNSAVSAIHT